MRREWIEILKTEDVFDMPARLPPCGGSGLKYHGTGFLQFVVQSPSMRREWIEMSSTGLALSTPKVSLHAEGVD